jgi:fructokinase
VLGADHGVSVGALRPIAGEGDLAWLDPQRSGADAARMLLEAGPGVVLLIRGADGVQVVTGAGGVPVPAPEVEVVDTIGAGDAFGGGLLAW